MEDQQYGRAYGANPMADDFATYALPESPSSLNSSFSHDSAVPFMHALPPKPSPRMRNSGVNRVTGVSPGKQSEGHFDRASHASPAKQWPPHGFKAPTLQTAESEEHWDSTSPETDWLSPASRSSALDECATPPTARWGPRSANDGVGRQWQNSPKTSPRGERISPRTKKLQMQSAETFEDARHEVRGYEFRGLEVRGHDSRGTDIRGNEVRGNALARVEEGYVLNAHGVSAGYGVDAEMELRSKWQRFQEEEQRKRMRVTEQGRQAGVQEQGESHWQRAEFRRYERPWGRAPPGEGPESEEQLHEEELRQERWRQLKHDETERQMQLDGRMSAMIAPSMTSSLTLAEWEEPQTAPQAPRMVRRKCWAKGEGDVLVKQDCWVEEPVPGVSAQGPPHPPSHSMPRQPHPPNQPSFDRWQEEDQEAPETSGRGHFPQEGYTERPSAMRGPEPGQDNPGEAFANQRQGWGNQGGGWVPQEQGYERPRSEHRERSYDSEPLQSSQSAQWGSASGSDRWHASMAVATFPRSAKERADWEAQGRGWEGADWDGQGGAADPPKRGRVAEPVGKAEGGFEQDLRSSIEQRWNEQAGRELQIAEGVSNVVVSLPPGTVASIEQRVSEVGYVAKDEKIWVEERRTSTSKALVVDEPAAGKVSRGESSPTLVAEAVSRLALTQVGWDEAMHNFHDLRGVRAVVKRPEELLSPAAPVTGAVTLSGLARKRAVSLLSPGGEMQLTDKQGKSEEVNLVAEQADRPKHVRASSDIESVREAVRMLPAVSEGVGMLPAGSEGVWALPAGGEAGRMLPAGEERPSSRPGSSRPGSARERGAWSEADISEGNVVNRGSAPRPRRSDGRTSFGGHSLPLSVAAIVSPPFARVQDPPVSLVRSDTYPPSERNPPSERASAVWSTSITSVPLLAQPPVRARAGGFRPTQTHPSSIPPPLPLLPEWELRAQGLVPHPPCSPSPTARPPRRSSSRSGVPSFDERRPIPPEVALVYDSEPGPRRSSPRGLNFLEAGTGNESDGYDEALGARRREDLTPRQEDGSQSARSRFAPTPRRVGPGPPMTGHADGFANGEERPKIVVEVDCPICAKPLQVGRAMFAPECGHFVHFDCCRSNLLKGSLDCVRCHQRMLEKPYLKTSYRPPGS